MKQYLVKASIIEYEGTNKKYIPVGKGILFDSTKKDEHSPLINGTLVIKDLGEIHLGIWERKY